jgi:HEAT repeat protein
VTAFFRLVETLLGDAVLEVVNRGLLALVVLCAFLGLGVLLLRARNSQVARRWSRFEREWQGQVLEALESPAAAAELQRSIHPGEARWFAEYLSRFARRLRGVERERLSELAAPFIPALFSRLGARSAPVRARATETLGWLAPRTARAALVAALDDPSLLVAANAVRALSRDPEPELARQVAARLHRFERWRPAFIASMVAAMGPGAAPVLRGILADRRKRTPVRVVAGEALVRLHDPEAADVAAALLAGEPEPPLAAVALLILATIGLPEHRAAARKRLDSPNDAVRINAARALGALAGPEDVPLLARALEDPSPWVAEHAARGLARGSGRAVLIEIAASNPGLALVSREALAQGPR